MIMIVIVLKISTKVGYNSNNPFNNNDNDDFIKNNETFMIYE